MWLVSFLHGLFLLDKISPWPTNKAIDEKSNCSYIIAKCGLSTFMKEQ